MPINNTTIIVRRIKGWHKWRWNCNQAVTVLAWHWISNDNSSHSFNRSPLGCVAKRFSLSCAIVLLWQLFLQSNEKLVGSTANCDQYVTECHGIVTKNVVILHRWTNNNVEKWSLTYCINRINSIFGEKNKKNLHMWRFFCIFAR